MHNRQLGLGNASALHGTQLMVVCVLRSKSGHQLAYKSNQNADVAHTAKWCRCGLTLGIMTCFSNTMLWGLAGLNHVLMDELDAKR